MPSRRCWMPSEVQANEEWQGMPLFLEDGAALIKMTWPWAGGQRRGWDREMLASLPFKRSHAHH